MRLRSFLLLVVALILSASVIRAQKAEQALRDADQAWFKVFAAKDLKKSVDFCLADGSVLPPNEPIATGHEAIEKNFAGFFALPNLMIDWKPTKTQIAGSGEMGVTSGVYQMSFTGPNGSTIKDTGKYVTVWKKEKGVWKVWLDIFNSDLPAAGN
jgi:ketosteroid isomerase-like protein